MIKNIIKTLADIRVINSNITQPCLGNTQGIQTDIQQCSGKLRPHLGEPVAVEDGAVEGFVAVDVGEVLEGDGVNVLICPTPLLILHQPGQQMMGVTNVL